MTRESARRDVRALARRHLARGDALGWFEALYSGVEGDFARIPWADGAPNPQLMQWLDAVGSAPGARVLTVGCGLGDDAEEWARRGGDVTAFDISPSAIDWCRRRFPASSVAYVVADVTQLPQDWAGRFAVVFEAYTLQVLPAAMRAPAMHALAACLSPEGRLLVIARLREPGEPEGEMPWPLTRDELQGFEAEGLELISTDVCFDDETPPQRRCRVLYRRAAEPPA